MNEVADLKHLRSLDLSCTEVTDAGLKPLGGLAQLQSLGGCQTAQPPLGDLVEHVIEIFASGFAPAQTGQRMNRLLGHRCFALRYDLVHILSPS